MEKVNHYNNEEIIEIIWSIKQATRNHLLKEEKLRGSIKTVW